MRYIVISATTLNLIDDCTEKYRLSRKCNLSLINTDGTVKDLEQGDTIHIGMAEYYRELKKGNKLSFKDIEEVMRVHSVNATDLREGELAEILKAVELYLSHWEFDSWEILEVEQPFIITLGVIPDTPEREGVTIIFQGKIDLMVRTANNQEMIVDHKKASQKRYPHSLYHQNMGYCLALNKRYICLNYIGTQNSKDISNRLHRHIISYTKGQLEEWRRIAIYKAVTTFTELELDWSNPNWGSCFKYGRPCEFLKICEADSMDRERLIRSLYTVKDFSGSLFAKSAPAELARATESNKVEGDNVSSSDLERGK